jgi:hypothetical protein
MEMRIGMCLDFMGCGEMTQDDEYTEIEKQFCKILGKKCSFVRDMYPHLLSNDMVDIYVFDFGGMMPGCQDTIDSHVRELIKQIEDHPNTLFVIWSDFTGRMFLELLENESKKYLGAHHNIIISNGLDGEVEKRLKELK